MHIYILRKKKVTEIWFSMQANLELEESGSHELIVSGMKVNVLAKSVSHGKGIKIEVLKSEKSIDFFTLENLGVVVPPKCNRCKLKTVKTVHLRSVNCLRANKGN